MCWAVHLKASERVCTSFRWTLASLITSGRSSIIIMLSSTSRAYFLQCSRKTRVNCFRNRKLIFFSIFLIFQPWFTVFSSNNSLRSFSRSEPSRVRIRVEEGEKITNSTITIFHRAEQNGNLWVSLKQEEFSKDFSHFHSAMRQMPGEEASNLRWCQGFFVRILHFRASNNCELFSV